MSGLVLVEHLGARPFPGLRIHICSTTREGVLLKRMTIATRVAEHEIVVEPGGGLEAHLCWFHRFITPPYLHWSAPLDLPRGGASKEFRVRAVVRHEWGVGWHVDLVGAAMPKPSQVRTRQPRKPRRPKPK